MASPGGVLIQFLVEADKARRDALAFAKSLGKVDTEASTVDGALKDVQRALDAVGDEAKHADMDTVARGFDDVADEAEKTADRLRRAAREMADAVGDGGAKIDRETDKLGTDLAATGKEAGAGFVGNLAEGIGSGQANVADIISGTLGDITQLTSAIPGIGAAAGIAAAGIGVVFGKMQAEGQKAKDRIDSLRGALEDLEDQSEENVKQAIFEQWIEDSKETTGLIEKVDQVLGMAGATADDFKAALAGDPAAVKRVTDQIAAQDKKLDRMRDNGEGLTDAQLDYLNNAKTVTAEITGQDAAIGAIRREQKAISDLTGVSADNIDKQTQNLIDAAAKARILAAELDTATKDRDIEIALKVKGGASMGEALGGYWGKTAPATAAATQTATPVAVNVYTSGPTIPNSPRAVRALLDRHDLRMGRRPGTPRSVAW